MDLVPARHLASSVLRPRRAWWFGGLLLLVAMLVVVPGLAPTRMSTCERYNVLVSLSPDSPQRYRITGWLCQPRRRTTTVQVLLSGFSYDHSYWTIGDTSYLRAALGAGSAVYAVDRIGVGLSNHPPADQVTVPTQAYTAHQVVTALRRSYPNFRRVVGVGHSMGSAIWMVEAALHHDVDALILTSYLQPRRPAAGGAWHSWYRRPAHLWCRHRTREHYVMQGSDPGHAHDGRVQV